MSDPFANFLEPIMLKGYPEPIGDAYRMDATAPNRSMRDHAGLGTLHCCDYLKRLGDDTALIEDTQLGQTVLDMADEYHAIAEDKRHQYIRERIRRENALKVYGSLLVLCRMQQWPDRCVFWLVLTGETGTAKVARNLSPNGELEAELKAALIGGRTLDGTLKGAGLVADVKILTADELRKLLNP